ncbi:MAG TPA: hypothetical protein PJ994_02465 [Tepidiformaceae bacterium]|nr:hypothetical protein [Tepidiformaceae bacterium]
MGHTQWPGEPGRWISLLADHLDEHFVAGSWVPVHFHEPREPRPRRVGEDGVEGRVEHVDHPGRARAQVPPEGFEAAALSLPRGNEVEGPEHGIGEVEPFAKVQRFYIATHKAHAALYLQRLPCKVLARGPEHPFRDVDAGRVDPGASQFEDYPPVAATKLQRVPAG